MDTFTEVIPTVFYPETEFAIVLDSTDKQHNRAKETFPPHVFVWPTDEFARRGFTESALHD